MTSPTNRATDRVVSRRTLSALGLAAALALTGCGAGAASSTDDGPAAQVSVNRNGFVAGTPISDGWSMPDVTLTDTNGAKYNLRTSPTTPVVLLFFGYSNCPDVCNGIIADLASARLRSPDDIRSKVTIVVVTTDPARDTASVMKTWLARIDSTVVGLTGALTTIKAAAKTVGVDIEQGTKLPSGGYEIVHGTQVLGFGTNHTAQVLWSTGTSVADYKADIARLVELQS